MKNDVWDTILRPTLSDQMGDALFIGTPEGRNHFYDMYVDAQKYEDWNNPDLHVLRQPLRT